MDTTAPAESADPNDLKLPRLDEASSFLWAHQPKACADARLEVLS